jgi:2'-5' RNA ligase
MRLFIAITLPENIKIKLEEIVKTFKKCDLDAKWVKTQNIHMTLKFLGEVDEAQLGEIKNIITAVAGEFRQLSVNLTGYGFFPNEKRPRVFFVATDKQELLKNMAMRLEDELEKLGILKEDRFRSHLSLCRFKGTKNIEVLKKEVKNITPQGQFPVEAISLFKSTLTPQGPIYDEIFKASLKI